MTTFYRQTGAFEQGGYGFVERLCYMPRRKRVFAVGTDATARCCGMFSDDGAATWAPTNVQELGTPVGAPQGRGVAYDNTNDVLVLCGTNNQASPNTVSYSLDGGSTWTPSNPLTGSSSGLYVTYSSSQGKWAVIGIGAGATNGLAYTADPTSGWTGTPGPFQAGSGTAQGEWIEYIDDLSLWIAVGVKSSTGRYAASSTDLVTWTTHNPVTLFNRGLTLHWLHGTSRLLVGYFLGTGAQTLETSDDAGTGWTYTDRTTSLHAQVIGFLETSFGSWPLYACGQDVPLTKTLDGSTDNGSSWTNVPNIMDGGIITSMIYLPDFGYDLFGGFPADTGQPMMMTDAPPPVMASQIYRRL